MSVSCSTELAMQLILAGEIDKWSIYAYCRKWYMDCPF